MKMLLIMASAISALSLMVGCAANNTTTAHSTAAEPQTEGQEYRVNSPNSSTGHYNNVPNNGSTTAAKMINPMTP